MTCSYATAVHDACALASCVAAVGLALAACVTPPVVTDLSLAATPKVGERSRSSSPETSLVSVATDGTRSDRHSFDPSVSSEGRYIGFESFASNLVPDDTNNKAPA